MNKIIKNLIFAIVILILIALNIYIFISNNSKKKENDRKEENELNQAMSGYSVNDYSVNDVATKEQYENSIKEVLQTKTEKTRMQTYVGEFLDFIDFGKYDNAYSLLNSDFKTNNFKTIDDFKKYCAENFPKDIALNYVNIERQGEYWIVTADIWDTSNIDYSTIEKRFVVKENGNNDFTISFQKENVLLSAVESEEQDD